MQPIQKDFSEHNFINFVFSEERESVQTAIGKCTFDVSEKGSVFKKDDTGDDEDEISDEDSDFAD